MVRWARPEADVCAPSVQYVVIPKLGEVHTQLMYRRSDIEPCHGMVAEDQDRNLTDVSESWKHGPLVAMEISDNHLQFTM